jgi:hypothetical protein
MNRPPPEFAAEPTDIGLQTLIPELAPITSTDRLALRAAAPMRPKKLQRPCDFGLFDLAARDQLDLFTKSPPSGDEGPPTKPLV